MDDAALEMTDMLEPISARIKIGRLTEPIRFIHSSDINPEGYRQVRLPTNSKSEA